MSHKNTWTYQELGHVKSQILDEAESVLSYWTYVSQTGLVVLRGFEKSWTEGTQGDKHHLAAVMSCKSGEAHSDEWSSLNTHISCTNNREKHVSQLACGR